MVLPLPVAHGAFAPRGRDGRDCISPGLQVPGSADLPKISCTRCRTLAADSGEGPCVHMKTDHAPDGHGVVTLGATYAARGHDLLHPPRTIASSTFLRSSSA
jgi:hypothetical protein